jgi:hypothetical protein
MKKRGINKPADLGEVDQTQLLIEIRCETQQQLHEHTKQIRAITVMALYQL